MGLTSFHCQLVGTSSVTCSLNFAVFLTGKRLPDFDLFISSVLPLDHKGVEVINCYEFMVHNSNLQILCITTFERALRIQRLSPKWRLFLFG